MDGVDEGGSRRPSPHIKKTKRSGELEEAIRKPIRPQVNRPRGLVVTTDRERMQATNAEMVQLHEKAIDAARRDKLQLLLRRYSLAKDDWYGLALALAVEHEPGFQVDSQLVVFEVGLGEEAQDTPGDPDEREPAEFSGGVRIEDGKIAVHIKDGKLFGSLVRQKGRPVEWTGERLDQFLAAVKHEKRKYGYTQDTKALRSLARKKEWAPHPNHKGVLDSWVRTLQVRLSNAKRIQREFQRLVDAARRSLQEAAGGLIDNEE